MAGADDHAGHDDELEMMMMDEEKPFNIKGFKIGMLFAIWVCCMAGVLPKVVPAVNKNPLVLSFLNCFSAGIFLGMALIHIIPEGIDVYSEWAESEGIEKPFPLPYVLIFVGYLIVLSVDRVIAGFLLKLTGKEAEAHAAHGHGGGDHDHGEAHAHMGDEGAHHHEHKHENEAHVHLDKREVDCSPRNSN